MPRRAVSIDLSPEERSEFERLRRSASTPQALARRARMILMAGDGADVVETAERLDVWRKGVSLWRARWPASCHRRAIAQ